MWYSSRFKRVPTIMLPHFAFNTVGRCFYVRVGSRYCRALSLSWKTLTITQIVRRISIVGQRDISSEKNFSLMTQKNCQKRKGSRKAEVSTWQANLDLVSFPVWSDYLMAVSSLPIPHHWLVIHLLSHFCLPHGQFPVASGPVQTFLP